MASSTGDPVDADASLENEPGFLFDALVLPDGVDSALAADGNALAAIRGVYRHCKPIAAFGTGARLLSAAGVDIQARDAAVFIAAAAAGGVVEQFVGAFGAPRNFDRERDPPRV